MAKAMTIGRVSDLTGCKIQTIRYYEEIGVLHPPDRSSGNQRRYEPAHVERLIFVRHARELGFSLPAIRDLLSLSDDPGQSCEAVDAIARAQLDQVEHRLKRLKLLRVELKRMISECGGGKIADCRVIEVIANHSKCVSDHHA